MRIALPATMPGRVLRPRSCCADAPHPSPRPRPPPQERATKVSHGNTARMAGEYGDDVLQKVRGARGCVPGARPAPALDGTLAPAPPPASPPPPPPPPPLPPHPSPTHPPTHPLQICGAFAADESRHEVAYTRIVDEFFRLDPNNAMLSFADMMRKQIVMPGEGGRRGARGRGSSGLLCRPARCARRVGVWCPARTPADARAPPPPAPPLPQPT